MPDNLAVLPSTATGAVPVSTEEVTTLNGASVAAQHAQRVIPALRTSDGVVNDVSTTNPQPVNVVAGSASGTEYAEGATAATPSGTAAFAKNPSNLMVPVRVDASGNLFVAIADGSFSLVSGADPLTVGGDSDLIKPTITISTTAYTIGDVVGGRIQLTNAMGTLRSGMPTHLYIKWIGTLAPALDLIFFDSQPTQNTSDNSPFNWNAADDTKDIWYQAVETTDYFTMPGATARRRAKITLPAPVMVTAATSDLWLFIITRTTFTAAATTDLRLQLGMTKD